MSSIQLSWKSGTGFDLFVSLHVLHEPKRFGLRPAWAAGVRSRLCAQDRETLEAAETVIWPPFHWVEKLPQPQDTATVLLSLEQISAKDRLPVLGSRPGLPDGIVEIFLNVAARGSWIAKDLEALLSAYQSSSLSPRSKQIEEKLRVWAEAESFGKRYLAALTAYNDVFFSEEETRITHAIQVSLKEAQAQAAQIPLESLIESLSHGVRLERSIDLDTLILVPSYWIAPLVVIEKLGKRQELFLFGARPSHVSLVPGDWVPDGMLRTIKTLGDPTRLRILRYLSEDSIAPAELARRLRLRPPTVTHHLNLLRLAGLVFLTLEEDGGQRYEARPEAVDEAFEILKSFLCSPSEDLKC
jgi:DNA-binding transcriptional ArsR family regulator